MIAASCAGWLAFAVSHLPATPPHELHGCFTEPPVSGRARYPRRMTQDLQVEKYQEGSGQMAEKGKMVSVHYTGTLENGQKFDSSRDRGQPIEFPLGVGYVIPGWDQGIAQMRVGDKARLTIPGNLAYGEAGVPGIIPPNATLIFDVELMDVR